MMTAGQAFSSILIDNRQFEIKLGLISAALLSPVFVLWARFPEQRLVIESMVRRAERMRELTSSAYQISEHSL